MAIFSAPRVKQSDRRYPAIVAAFKAKYPEISKISNLCRIVTERGGAYYSADLWKGSKRYYPPSGGGMCSANGSVSVSDIHL
jgi:hypothetical protein